MVFSSLVESDNIYMPWDICRTLGQHIRILRKKYDLTQYELAENAGISTKYLQNLEGKNPKKATIVTLQKLAKGFNIPMWQLLKFKK